MRVTAMQEYGLRCMLQIASHKVGVPLPVREIAKRERLTPVYVEKILVNLRKAGLVKSLRGVHGGYVISLSPKDISVAAVLSALGQVDLGPPVVVLRATPRPVFTTGIAVSAPSGVS